MISQEGNVGVVAKSDEPQRVGENSRDEPFVVDNWNEKKKKKLIIILAKKRKKKRLIFFLPQK